MYHRGVIRRTHGGPDDDDEDKKSFLKRVKITIKCIVASTNVKCTVSTLNRDFRDLEGESIPYAAFRFNDLLSFLHSIWDVIELDDSGTISIAHHPELADKCKHVQQFVSKQKSNQITPQRFCVPRTQPMFTPKGVEPGIASVPLFRKPTKYDAGSFVYFTIQQDALKIVNQNKGIQVKDFETKINKCIQSRVHPKENVDTMYCGIEHMLKNGLGHFLVSYDGQVFPNTGEYSKDVQNFGLNAANMEYVTIVKESVIQNLQMILLEEPQGIWSTELATEYKNRFLSELNYHIYGFESVIQFIASMPELFKIIQHKANWEVLIIDIRNPFPPERKVSEKDKGNILQLLKLFEEEGIALDLFLPLYKITFNRDFFHDLVFFETLEDAMISLSTDGVRVTTENDERRIYLDTSANDPSIEKAIPFMWDTRRLVLRITGTLGPDAKIPIFSLPSNWHVNKVVEIIPLDVFGPHCFFATRNDGGVEAVTSALESSYSKRLDHYVIAISGCKVGQFCCAKFEDKFYRGYIVEAQVESSFVTVLFIDFGRIQLIQKGHLYFLEDKFKCIPNLAFLCSMNSIIPSTGPKYSSDANIFFLKMLSNSTKLVAKIRNISKEMLHLQVSLMDMRPDRNVLFDCLLCQEGHAMPMFRNPPKEPLLYAYWLLFFKRMKHY